MSSIGSFGNSFSFGRGNCNCGCGCGRTNNNQPPNKTGKGGGADGVTGQEPNLIKEKAADEARFSRTLFTGANGPGGDGRSSTTWGAPF